jgi:hypothetical protein
MEMAVKEGSATSAQLLYVCAAEKRTKFHGVMGNE